MTATGYYRCNAAITLTLVLLAALGALLLQKPKMAWNAGSRERLSEALRMIGTGLWEGRVSAQDFMPRSIEDRGDPSLDANELADKHGVVCNWYQDGDFEKILFYPMAISHQIVIQPHSKVEARPQILMVPLDVSDRGSLPNLRGCTNAAAKALWDCQMREIRERFFAHGIAYAATLMSDGCVIYTRVDDVTHLGNTSREG
jgi:hypothetical protein